MIQTGGITLDKSEAAGWNMTNAYEALMYSEATPLYDLSIYKL